MHQSRIAAFLIGAWIFGGLFFVYVSAQNADLADNLLKSAPSADATRVVQRIGADQPLQQLYRYLGAEQNRANQEDWEVAQIALGCTIIAILFWGSETRMLSAVALAMVILTVFERLKLTPELTWLGRSIDFITWTAESQQRDQYWRLHTVYIVIECVKLALAIGIAGFLFTMRRKRVRPRVQVDAVNYAQHRHVDR